MSRAAGLGASAAALAVLLLGGCGYSLRGTLPPHVRTVAVPVFKNRTAEPLVDQILTRAVVQALSTNGRLRVVGLEEADAVLEGEVTGFEVQSIAFDPRANVRRYRVVVTLNLRMRDRREGAVLFDRQGLEERADFRVPGGGAETIAREETALNAAAAEIARTVVSLAVERF